MNKETIAVSAKERKIAKGHKLLRNNDPMINPMSYDVDLMLALNFYNREHNSKEKRAWAVAHYGKGVKFSSDIPDYRFKTLGALCRIVDNGNSLSEKHTIVMENEFDLLQKVVQSKKIEVVVDTKPVIGIQEKMDQKVSEFLGEFAGLVDEYTMTRTNPNVEKLVNSMGIRGPMVKKVLARVSGTMEELQEAIAGVDKYLVEGYSNFKKSELKKLLGIYQQLESALVQAKVLTVRKTRVAKVKPASVIAAKVKYQIENADLNLKSINPATVVGASELYLFNTKYRKMQYYEAVVGKELTWKGTTLLNFSVEKSFSKTIRKPEVIQSLEGKRMFAKFVKEAKATPGKVTGRVNAECVLIAAFR